MSNAIDKYIVITFPKINNPYPYYPYMLITKNYSSKFTTTSFWVPSLNSLTENGIPKKSLDTSLNSDLVVPC